MRWHRIQALLIRHLYLYQRSVPRLMDIFYWPVMELLVWGFLTRYLEKAGLGGINVVTIILGALVFWDILSQGQRAVSVVFLEEVWERNILNIFVTPLRISEFLVSTVLVGLVRIILAGTVISILAFLLYSFNIFTFGFYLVPLIFNLLLFGWALGLFTTAIILRFGSSAQVLAFGFIFLIQPFSAVFYPVSALPQQLQYVAWALPSTWAFEGMREVVKTGAFPFMHVLASFGLNIIYLTVVFFIFYKMFAYVKNKGLLLKLD